MRKTVTGPVCLSKRERDGKIEVLGIVPDERAD